MQPGSLKRLGRLVVRALDLRLDGRELILGRRG